MLTERRQPAIVNLLSEDAICKLLTCCMLQEKMSSASCQVLQVVNLLLERCQPAIGRCDLQVVKLLTEDAVGKDVVFRC